MARRPYLPCLTPLLQEKLEKESKARVAEIVKLNWSTVFAREAPLLADFRMTCSPIDSQEAAPEDTDKIFSEFQELVPLSTYQDYQPFTSRLCGNWTERANIRDLLCKGYPEYIGHTSGTTGGHKRFPKYAAFRMFPNYLSEPSGMSCRLVSLRYYDTVVMDTDEEPIEIPICPATSGNFRVTRNLPVKDDQLTMTKKDASLSSPFAAYYIPAYKSTLLAHAFFAVLEPSLITIQSTFSTILHDYIRMLETHWEAVIQAVEDGELPNVTGLEYGNTVHQMKMFVKPNPQRAEALRSVKKGAQGWLSEIWPGLQIIRTVVGGVYGFIIPKLQHHFGPTVRITNPLFGATECFLGVSYDDEDYNLFRMTSAEHFEYLDVERLDDRATDLKQSWELQPGKIYEVVLTTHDGLWRYRMGDLILIMGFDPLDGQPVIRYSSRHSQISIAGEKITENVFQESISSQRVAQSLGTVLEFCVVIDDRGALPSYGFIVELDGVNLVNALSHLHASLAETSPEYRRLAEAGRIGNPTIRIVPTGTFMEYREWRVEASGSAMGQTKTPVTVKDEIVKVWFVRRAVFEVGL